MITLESLKEEMQPYKNTLVLDFFKVVRLVDVIDGGDDFYWVYDTNNGIVHSSCVTTWISLKDKLNKADYKRLVHVWNMNHTEPAE